MPLSQIPCFVATVLVIAGYLLQIVHLIKERCTPASASRLSLWCAASFLFLIHRISESMPSKPHERRMADGEARHTSRRHA